MDDWQDAWNKYNSTLARMCCYGQITEEEMEAALDEGQQEDNVLGLITVAERHGVNLGPSQAGWEEYRRARELHEPYERM